MQISNYKKAFPNWADYETKKWSPWIYAIEDFNVIEITRNFYVRELLNKNQLEFKIEKVIKKIGKKLYVQCKSYEN